jgi:nucleoside phosphorylase
MEENLVDFAIITAIEVERQAICQALQMTDKHKVSQEARTYWKNRLKLKDGEFYEIVVTQLHDAASIDAVRAVDDLIRDYQPGALLMVGIAAAAKEGVALGDIVVGREVYYYERGKEIVGGILPEPKQYAADETLWDRVISVPKWKSPISIARPDGTDARPQIKYGVIASGEKVIANADIRNEIAASNRKIIAIEMEGYGVSAAAYKQYQPVRCLVIRTISDLGDANKNDEWQPYAAAVAAEFTKHFLRDKPLKPRNKRIPSPPSKLGIDYKVVTEAIIQGQLIPFLGEGINSCDRTANDCEWEPGLYPPNDSDLADYLAKKYDLVIPSPIKCPNLEQLRREHQGETLSWQSKISS